MSLSTITAPGTDRRPLSVRKIPGWKGLANFLVAKGVTPDMVSIAGLIVGVSSGFSLAATAWCASGSSIAIVFWVAAAVLILVRGFCNILDGIIAVEAGKATRVGLLYNEVPDRLADAATLIGAGFAAGGEANLGWVAALIAVLVAYARVQCGVTGIEQDFCGPMAKPMRMILIVGGALFSAFAPERWILTWGPDEAWGPMAIVLILIIAGGIWTFLRRLGRAAQKLKLPPQ